MERFPELLSIFKDWPMRSTLRYASIRLEFEACLLEGIPAETVIEGTRQYLSRQVPKDTSNYYVLAPHNFLRERAFLAYLPEQKLRAVT